MPRTKKSGEKGSSSSKNYSVIEGKSLDPTHFSSDLLDLLEYQGLLENFLLVEHTIYPNLVKEFYKNLELKNVKGSTVVKSFVKKTKIELTPPKLAKWFKLTLSGITEYQRENWIETDEYKYRNYLQYMLDKNNDIGWNDRPVKYDLCGEKRVLTIIVSECLLPSKNKSKYIGSLECTFAYFLKHKIKFNLPVLMLKHMAFCKEANRVNLPYGMLLSWIFVQEKVDVRGESSKRTGRTILNAQNLRHFELYRVDGNKYLSLHDVNQLPNDEKRALLENLNISNKRARAAIDEVEEEGDDDSEDEERMEERGVNVAAETNEETENISRNDTQATILQMLEKFHQDVKKDIASLGKKVNRYFRRLACLEAHLGFKAPQELLSSDDEGNGATVVGSREIDETRGEHEGTSLDHGKGKAPIRD